MYLETENENSLYVQATEVSSYIMPKTWYRTRLLLALQPTFS